MNRAIKILLGAIATIILGAIGSGFWEKVLSPLLSYISNKITNGISSISSSYSESIYKQASNLNLINSDGGLAYTLLFILFFCFLLNALSSKSKNIAVSVIHKVILSGFTGWRGIFYFASIIVMLIFMASRQLAVEKIQLYSSKQMEIVRPYIGEQKYFKLKSDYLKIENEVNFNYFLTELYAEAEAKSITIEKFKK